MAEKELHMGLPWGYDSIDEGPERGHFVLYDDDVIIATINGAIPEGPANAAHIHEACNNYERVKAERDALLTACRFAKAQIRKNAPKKALPMLSKVIAQAKKGEPA